MIERRKHPECIRQEDWGEIKEFVKNTTNYRLGIHDTFEQIRKENKERFEILLNQIRDNRVEAMNQSDLIVASIHANKKDQDDMCEAKDERIRSLEHSRGFISGVVALIVMVLIPIALALLK